MAQSPCLSLTKSRQPIWLIPRIPTSIFGHCAIADIATDQWASVDWGSEPAPPFAQRSAHAQCLLCVCPSCHTQKLACPKPRTSLLPLWSCCPRSLVPSSISTALAAHSTRRSQHLIATTALTHTAAPFAHSWKMHLIHPLRASAHAAATSRVYLLIACACTTRFMLVWHVALCALRCCCCNIDRSAPTSDHQRFAGSCTCHKQRITNINFDGASESDMCVTVTVRTVWRFQRKSGLPYTAIHLYPHPQYHDVSCRRSLCIRWIIRRWSIRWLGQPANRVVAASCEAVKLLQVTLI